MTAHTFEGSWRLLSRIDRAADGTTRNEPTLGSDPVAMLTYVAGSFAAQFMKRDRSSAPTLAATHNNTGALGGYDAYFGSYTVGADGMVEHRLLGALTAANVGMTFQRRLTVKNGLLVIELETATAAGEPVTRTLTWERIS